MKRILHGIMIENIKKGVELRLDAVLLENGSVGFPILKKYGECPSVLFFVLPKNSPLIASARYDIMVNRVTVSQTFTRSGHQKIFAAVKMICMVQYDNTYYLPEEHLLVQEKRSGQAIFRRDVSHMEMILTKYRDADVVFSVNQVSVVGIDGKEKIHYFEVLDGISKHVLVAEKASKLAQEASASGGHGTKEKFMKIAKNEIGNYFMALPKLPPKSMAPYK